MWNQYQFFFYIPFLEWNKKVGESWVSYPIKPFHEIIKEIQAKRREYEKGHILNLLYKEMGNSIYGNVVRGMSNKKSFDTKTGKGFRLSATEVSNPILASWTTAFIRSVIGECLHNIPKLGGTVLSVTTDGFVTNIKDLESNLLSLNKKKNDIPLFTLYRKLREDLSNNPEALENKKKASGMLSWATRGQLGIDADINATTGFQRSDYTKKELITHFKGVLASKEKEFEYIQTRLRGAKDFLWMTLT